MSVSTRVRTAASLLVEQTASGTYASCPWRVSGMSLTPRWAAVAVGGTRGRPYARHLGGDGLVDDAQDAGSQWHDP